MNTRSHLPLSSLLRINWPKIYRWLVIVIFVLCLRIGSLLLLQDQSVAAAQTQPNLMQQAETDQLAEQCYHFFEQANYQQMLETCSYAVDAVRSKGRRKDEAHMINLLGIAHNEKGQYQRSIYYFIQSLQMAEEFKDQVLQAWILNNLGVGIQH
ncbi:MAG: hypothetical protein ACFB8W_17590 [Elainellaceae cyanobacterium]